MIDLGHGVTLRFTSCKAHGEKTGAIVAFGECEGLVVWCPCGDAQGRNRWTLVSLEPLHLEPSIECSTHPEHHGWIRDGQWVPA